MLATALILFLAIGLHEYAHCKFADMAGDPTPAYYGRVTLDLTKHFEMSGVIMMVITTMTGFGIGWGKPSPVNPAKMRNPRLDWFISVAAGPISNLVQATIYALILRLGIKAQIFEQLGDPSIRMFVSAWLVYGVAINIGLACFNLIPFGPLDGHWLVGLMLPEKQRHYWFKFNQQVGMPGLFVVIILMQVLNISLLNGPVSYLFKLLVGIPFRTGFELVFT